MIIARSSRNITVWSAFALALSACSDPQPGAKQDSDDGASASGGDGSGAETATGGMDGGLTIEVPDEGQGGAAPVTGPECTPKAIGLLRDFQSIYAVGSPVAGQTELHVLCPVYQDFQNDGAWAAKKAPIDHIGYPERGIPATDLGPDQKPVLSDPNKSFNTIHSAETFDAWYRDDKNCTKTFEYELPMEVDANTGNLSFDSSAFFPLDGTGFGDSETHNYHFTFELHMRFVYHEGDTFNFDGDDDLYVYIDGKLALDLGGAHAPEAGQIDLDSLGLTPGKEYDIDFFHAERSQWESNFHIETSLQFSNCKPIIVR